MSKETYYMWKQTYLICKEPYFSRKEPYCSPKEPYFSRKEPYFSWTEPSENRLIFRGQCDSSILSAPHPLKKRSKTCYKETSYMIKRPIACENRPITHAKRSLTCYKETYSLWKETYYKWKDFFLFREYWASSTLSALRLFYLVFLSIKSEKSPISNPKRAPFHMKRVIRRRKETYFVRVLSQQHTVSATSTQKEICDTSKRHLLHV